MSNLHYNLKTIIILILLNFNNDLNNYNNSNYKPLIQNILQNLNNGINNDKNINLNISQSSPPFNNNRNDDDLQRQLAFKKEKLFLNEDINLSIKEKI